MTIVIHRVNTRAALSQIPEEYGVEIDLRTAGSKIVLNHEPFLGGEALEDWLDSYSHALLVLNVKEAGIETEVLSKVRGRGITECFLLDVEFPYLYRASRKGERAIAVRYSEDEPIEFVDRYRSLVNWVWIDTNTTLPLNAESVAKLSGMKTCLVCPERWGRPGDIARYQEQMMSIAFTPTAVMTAEKYSEQWRRWRS